MTVKIEDINRLTAELRARYQDDDGDMDPDEWAKNNNIDPESLQRVIGAAVNAAHDQMRAEIAKMAQEAVETGDIEPGKIHMTKLDIAEYIGNSCVHMFIIGWEAGRQYGGS